MEIRRATPYLVGLVIGSVLAAVADALSYWYGVESSAVLAVWPAIFLILLILWVVEDSKGYPSIYKPFDFGFLAFVFAVPYLPYYLWRTRRFKGLLFLAGLAVLYLLGHLTKLVIYLLYADS